MVHVYHGEYGESLNGEFKMRVCDICYKNYLVEKERVIVEKDRESKVKGVENFFEDLR